MASILRDPIRRLLYVKFSLFDFRGRWYVHIGKWYVLIYQGIVTMFVLMNFSLATFMDPGVIPRGNKIEFVTLKALSFGNSCI